MPPLLISERFDMTSIALKDIWIDRASRQRKEIIIDDLLESIPLRGVLVPIIVTSEQGPAGQPYKLIAGERRFTASRKLGLPEIPARLLADLDPIEQRLGWMHALVELVPQRFVVLFDLCAFSLGLQPQKHPSNERPFVHF